MRLKYKSCFALIFIKHGLRIVNSITTFVKKTKSSDSISKVSCEYIFKVEFGSEEQAGRVNQRSIFPLTLEDGWKTCVAQ